MLHLPLPSAVTFSVPSPPVQSGAPGVYVITRFSFGAAVPFSGVLPVSNAPAGGEVIVTCRAVATGTAGVPVGPQATDVLDALVGCGALFDGWAVWIVMLPATPLPLNVTPCVPPPVGVSVPSY